MKRGQGDASTFSGLGRVAWDRIVLQLTILRPWSRCMGLLHRTKTHCVWIILIHLHAMAVSQCVVEAMSSRVSCAGLRLL